MTITTSTVTPDTATPPASVTVAAAPYAAEGPLISGTSLTSNTIDTVINKVFKIEEFNRSFSNGVRLRFTAVGFTNVWLEGVVVAWDGTNLTLDPDFSAGAGTFSNWTVNVAGQPGAQGPIGATGPQGPTGGPAGPTGPAGTPGSVWRDGTGVPANSLGVNGDYYLNDATGDVYLRSASVYSIVANIHGVAGATGATGPTGATGATGPQGIVPDAPVDGNFYSRRNAAWAQPPGGGDVQHTLTLTAGAGLTGGGDLSANRTFAVSPGAGITVGGGTTALVVPVAIVNGGTGATDAVTALNLLGGAPLANPAFTGNPTAPTPPTADNDTSIATTAFVNAQGYLKSNATAQFTVGYTFAPNNIGNMTGTYTPNPVLGNYQYGSLTGALTFNVPGTDCAMDVMITNGATAGAITFSGYTVAAGNTGDPLTTINGNRFIISIRRINAISTYTIKALQ